tara:strand:+ start:24 stop:611 length:588 start_codon:yes stop_codon:yes gene_type:complete
MEIYKSRLCWNCNNEINDNTLICEKCNKIQSPDKINEFDLFGLKKNFKVDINKLEDKYLKLQQLFHPDKFSNLSEKERKNSTLLSSLINEAYKNLKNPIERVNLLLKLNGYKLSAENESFNDNDVLEEIMEIQNRCINADDSESKGQILDDLNLKINTVLKEISDLFQEKKYNNVSRLNIKLSYLEKIKKNLKSK